jgi:uncharacterized protein YciI
MYFVISCHDKPNHEALRAQTRPEHLEYIAGLESSIKVAGPLLAPDGASPRGSLLIVEAADLAEAERFTKHDPYNKVGLFETVTITPIRPVVGDWLPAKLRP